MDFESSSNNVFFQRRVVGIRFSSSIYMVQNTIDFLYKKTPRYKLNFINSHEILLISFIALSNVLNKKFQLDRHRSPFMIFLMFFLQICLHDVYVLRRKGQPFECDRIKSFFAHGCMPMNLKLSYHP
jgi:hypothetical protein